MEDSRLENRDPVHVARTLGSAHDADIAEALNAIEPGAAARVLAALPFDQAVRTLNHIRAAGHPQRPVYAVYVLDPVDRRLVHVVTLRELILADPTRTLLEVGDRRQPITVTTWADREEAARLIAKYDLLAVPVVDEGGHLLGIVTVDDMIDTMVKEQTEDLHKLGGVEALDQPYAKPPPACPLAASSAPSGSPASSPGKPSASTITVRTGCWSRSRWAPPWSGW